MTRVTWQEWFDDRGVFVHFRVEPSGEPLIQFTPMVSHEGASGGVAIRHRQGRSFNIDVRGERAARIASWLERHWT